MRHRHRRLRISGLVSCRLLSRQHEVQRLRGRPTGFGGQRIRGRWSAERAYAVDLPRFIVFNDWTYPKLHSSDGPTRGCFQADEMSFSVNEGLAPGLELTATASTVYSPSTQANLFSPGFIGMVRDFCVSTAKHWAI